MTLSLSAKMSLIILHSAQTCTVRTRHDYGTHRPKSPCGLSRVIPEDIKLSDTLDLNFRNSYKFKNPVAWSALGDLKDSKIIYRQELSIGTSKLEGLVSVFHFNSIVFDTVSYQR